MNYLQSLLALDGAAISNYEMALRSQDEQREVPGHVRLLIALNVEAETVATLAAVSASIANAMAKGGASTGPAPRSLVTFMPPDLTLLATSTAQVVDARLDKNLLKELQNFSSRLGFAKQLSRAFAAECGIKSQKSSVDVLALADAWRHGCGAAITALRALTAELEYYGAGLEAPAKTGLPDLLEVAARGLSPCVEPDGCVIVPGWAERRRHKRHKVDLAAEAILGLEIHPIRIFDLSAAGAGVTGLSSGRRGDALTVKLGSGRRLRGTIAWIAGSRAGVRFGSPLSAGDPLLCE